MMQKQTVEEMQAWFTKFADLHNSGAFKSLEWQLDRIEGEVEALDDRIVPQSLRGLLEEIMDLCTEARKAYANKDLDAVGIACMNLGTKWGEFCLQYRQPMLDYAEKDFAFWEYGGIAVYLHPKEKAIVDYFKGRETATEEEVYAAIWGEEKVVDRKAIINLNTTRSHLNTRLAEAGIPIQYVSERGVITRTGPPSSTGG